MKTPEGIMIYSKDYKALLKFRNFVQRYYPNYHICPKCGGVSSNQ